MQKKRENPSVSRSEFWGICCESGKKYSQVVRRKFHLSMAALDPTVSGTSPCVSLMVERGGCQYLLCNLKPDSILQVNLNLFFDKGENVTFSLKGRGTVHLSGYHILQDGDLSVSNDSGKSPSRNTTKNKNNSLDIDIADESDSDEDFDSSDDDDEEDEEDSKPNKNHALAKVTPTQKGNTPGATATKKATPNQKEAALKANIKAAALKAIMKDQKALKNILSKRTLEESSDDDEEEDEDEEDISDEESEDSSEDEKAPPPKQKPKDFQSNKRLKTNTSTPVQVKKAANQSTPKPSAVVIDLDSDVPKGVQKSFNKDGLDSSIGRTPMPKKSISSVFQSSLGQTPVIKKNLINKPSKGDSDSSDDNSVEMEVSTPNKTQSSTEQLNASAPNSESKKKRKKKKKKSDAANNDSNNKVSENTPSKQNESLSAKKFPGGLEYEDIKVGYGLEAKKGKLVHVYYTGKLENNKVFDSRSPGSKPFSFKLGSGQVIKGWDVGLEGMKVGGKRKLKIPPHLAYKNQRMGDIPPSSTLNFVVELKAVS